MTKIILQSLGLAGTILFISGYFPQIVKLIRFKKSEDLSVLAWLTWLVGGILLLIYAISTNDFVFIVLQAIQALLLLIIFILIIAYRKN